MNELEHIRQLSRIFTRPTLESLARTGTIQGVVGDLLRSRAAPRASSAVLAHLFDASLAELNSSYRCEYVYKAAIADRIVFGRHSPRTSSLAIELNVGRSIVDAAIFNGTSTAYEIKTEYDNHRRVATQTSDYLRAFDRVYLVTHPHLAQRYTELVDERVGILSLGEKNNLTELRAATGDISRVEPLVVFRMLRRQEFMDIAHEHFGLQQALPNGRIDAHYEALFATLTSEQAHQGLVRLMRARTTDSETVDFIRALPPSLRALAYATPLSRPQRQRVLDALVSPA